MNLMLLKLSCCLLLVAQSSHGTYKLARHFFQRACKFLDRGLHYAHQHGQGLVTGWQVGQTLDIAGRQQLATHEANLITNLSLALAKS